MNTVDTLTVSVRFLTAKAEASINKISRSIAVAEKRLRLMQRAAKAGLNFTPSTIKSSAAIKKFSANLVNAEARQKALNKQHLEAIRINNKLNAARKASAKKAEQVIKKQQQAEANAAKKRSDSMRGIQRSIMGAGLSFLFTGMAIKRFFQNILTSLLTLFIDVAGQSNVYVDQINELKASVFALGFSLFQSFAESGGLQTWIDRIEKLTNWFESLDTETQSMITSFITWGVVVGGAMMLVGQLMLFFLGVSMLFQSTAVAGAMLSVVVAILLIAVVWIYLKSLWKSDMPLWYKMLVSLVLIFSLLLVMLLLFGVAITLPIILAIAVIAVLITAFIAMANKVGGVGNAFKAFGIFLLAILAAIGDAITAVILVPLNSVIDLINKVMAASDRMFGTNFGQITVPAFLEVGGMSKAVFGMRNKLLEEGKGQSDFDKAIERVNANKKETTINVYGNVSSADDVKELFNPLLKYGDEITGSATGQSNGGA